MKVWEEWLKSLATKNMTSKKRMFKKGMEQVSKKSREKVLFGSFNQDGDGVCLNSKKQFITIARDELENDYVSLAQLHKESREKRKGQAW